MNLVGLGPSLNVSGQTKTIWKPYGAFQQINLNLIQGKMKQRNKEVCRKREEAHLPSRSLQHQLQRRLYFLKLQLLALHLQIPSPIHAKNKT